MDNIKRLNSNCNGFTFCNSLLNTVIESTYNAYLVVDTELFVVFFNNNLLNLFNFEKEEIENAYLPNIFKKLSDKIINKDALNKIESILNKSLSLNNEVHKLLHLKNKSEVLLYLKAFGQDSKTMGYILNFENNIINSNNLYSQSNAQGNILKNSYLEEISKLKLVQEELRNAKEDAERAKEDAEKANLAKSQFLANMSHEIRTPLFGVIGLLNILKKTSLTSEQGKYLDVMNNSAESLMLLINDVLDLSKIESANIELNNTVFDIRDNICDMVRSVSARAHIKGIEVLYEVSNDVPNAIESDLNRLRQVIVNLLTNAVKFSDSGEIVVTCDVDYCENENYTLHFAVKDSGIGISNDKQILIFEPFRQIESSYDRKYGGTGLGLSICKKIVEMMDGGIWVESSEGKGSTFHFIIQARGILSSKIKKESEHLSQLSDTNNYKVILCDGNKVSRKIHKNILQNAGFKVKTIDISKLSLAKIKLEVMNSLDYFICIINSPLKGHSFTKICSAIEERKDMKKILLTNSHNNLTDASKYIKSEIDNFLIKPVKIKEIIETIQNITNNKRKKEKTLINTNKKFKNEIKSEDPIENQISEPKLHVLISEDNEVNQLIISKILSDEGHSCVVTSGGQEAIDVYKKEYFDFIIMDIQMPGMDGFIATKNIRKLEKNTGKHIPIIALSAHALPEHKAKAIEAGMDYYLTKPFRHEEIQVIILEIKQNQQGKQKSTSENSFNIEALYEKLNSDSDFFKTFAEKFIDTTSNLLNEMQQAIHQLDGSHLSKSAHALKGTLSYVDAIKAVNLTIELETKGKEQDLEFANVLLKKLRIEVQNIIQTFIDFIAL